MKLELIHPRAISPRPARKPAMDVTLFSQQHGLSKDVARRIISISGNGDQARSIAELMK
jgi:hypothetical protein